MQRRHPQRVCECTPVNFHSAVRPMLGSAPLPSLPSSEIHYVHLLFFKLKENKSVKIIFKARRPRFFSRGGVKTFNLRKIQQRSGSSYTTVSIEISTLHQFFDQAASARHGLEPFHARCSSEPPHHGAARTKVVALLLQVQL